MFRLCVFGLWPPGDLTSNVSDNGIGELHSKRVARQIAAALEYMHLKYKIQPNDGNELNLIYDLSVGKFAIGTWNSTTF